MWLSSMHLGLALKDAMDNGQFYAPDMATETVLTDLWCSLGYSIFTIIPSSNSKASGLPSCSAADFGRKNPNPIRETGGVTTSFFTGVGNSLGGAGGSGGASPQPSTSAHTVSGAFTSGGITLGGASSSAGRNSARESAAPSHRGQKRAVGFDLSISDEDDDENEVEVLEGDVSDESEKRRIRPRLMVPSSSTESGASTIKPVHLTEEEEFELAIQASLQAETAASAATPASAAPSAAPSRTRVSSEDAELEAALLASLESSNIASPGESEPDDNPSVDEMRRRRLARFG